MSQIAALESNNNEIEKLLKSNSQDSDKIKAFIKKNKIIVYSVEDLAR